MNAVQPRDLALDAVLPGRRHGFRVIEAVDRNADAPRSLESVGELRAALIAEAALRHVRAFEERWPTARPAQVLALAAGQTHEWLAGGLLAHAAVAHARIGGFFQPLVAHRAALAAAGQVFRVAHLT